MDNFENSRLARSDIAAINFMPLLEQSKQEMAFDYWIIGILLSYVVD